MATRWRTSASLFGRKTYEHMAAHWPHESTGNPIAASLNTMPKYVATRTLRQQDLKWANCHVLDGDIIDAVQGSKRRERALSPSWAAACSCRRPSPTI